MKPKNTHRHLLAALGFATITLSSASAQTGTWNVDANGLWGTAGNWTPGIADGSGFTANFTNNITADRTVSLDSDRTINSVVFGDSDTATAGSWILDNNGISTNNLILAGTTPGITVNALGIGKTATISAIIEGTVGLVKNGSGTLNLTGANTYTGGTTVNAGTLSLSNTTTSGGNIVVGSTGNTGVALDISGGTYNIGTGGIFVGNSGTSGQTGTISQSGGTVNITSNGGGGLLVGNASSTGTYNLSAGSIVNGGTNAISRGLMLGVNGGNTATFNLSGTGILNMANSRLMVSRSDAAVSNINATYNQTGGTATFNSMTIGGTGTSTNLISNFSVTGGTFRADTFTSVGAASGTGNVATMTIGGTAEVTLGNFAGKNANHSVTLNLNGGTLKNAATGTFIGGTGGVMTNAFVMVGGAKFDTSLNSTTISQSLLTHGVSTGGGLTKLGTNTLSLSGTNTYTGGTSVTTGGLTFLNTNAKPTSGIHAFDAGTTLGLGVAASGTFFTATDVTNAFAGTMTGNLSNVTVTSTTKLGIDTTAGNFTYATSVAGSPSRELVKLGANTLTLTGANTYTGATTVSSGTLTLGGTNTSPTYNVNAGILSLEIASGATTPGQIATGAAVTVANGAALNINVPGGDATTTAAVLNNFALNLNGGTSLTFTGQNRATVTLPGAVTLTGANTVSFVQIRDTLVMGGAIGGTGSITFSGAGLQASHFVRLTAQSNYGGATGITSSTAGMTLLLSTGADRLPTGTTLTITGSGTAGNFAQLNLGGQSQTLAGLVSAGTAAQVGVVNTGGGTPTLTINNSVTNTFAGILGRTGPADADLNTLVSGSSFALTKTGVGNLTLSGANGYTGTTTITAGQLIIQNATSLGTTAANTVVSGTGTLFLGTANLSIAEALNLTGTGTSSSGALRFGGGQSGMAVTGAITLGGAALIQGDGSTGVTLSGGIDLGANALTYNVDGGATHSITTVKITGTSGTLVKSGGGTLNLNASNDYTGLTTVSGGALNIGSAGSLNSGNALTVGASGTSNFANAGQTLGAVSNDNTAVNALNFSAATGTVTLASLTGAGNTRFGSNGAVTGGIATGTVTSVGALNANISGTATIAAGGLLTGTISAGTVGANSLSSTSVTGGTNTITTTAAITTVNGGNTTVGAIATIGTLTSGTANLNGATSAITTLNGGTVNLGTTVLSVSNGTTSGSITGVNGSLTKTTSGMLTLNAGTYTYQGATNVNDGTLVVNGNISTSITTVQTGATLGGTGTVGALTIQAGGTHAPGNSPGIQNTGDYSNAGTLGIEMNSLTVGSGYDQVNTTGTVSLSGLLSVTMGFTPAANSLFFILANDGSDPITGTLFSNAPIDGNTYTFGGQDFQISYFGNQTSPGVGAFTGGNDVVLMAIPEPSAALLGAIGLLALLRRRR